MEGILSFIGYFILFAILTYLGIQVELDEHNEKKHIKKLKMKSTEYEGIIKNMEMCTYNEIDYLSCTIDLKDKQVTCMADIPNSKWGIDEKKGLYYIGFRYGLRKYYHINNGTQVKVYYDGSEYVSDIRLRCLKKGGGFSKVFLGICILIGLYYLYNILAMINFS